MDKTIQEKTGAILVIGGGIAGIQAALDAASAGRTVYLLESAPSIGGRMAQLDKTFPTNDCSLCILSPKLVEVGRHPRIKLLTYSELLRLSGTPGDFTAHVRRRARYVDESRCIGCGICSETCPVSIPDIYNASLAEIKTIRIPFAQAVPKIAVINKETCLRLTHGGSVCGKCEEACAAGAIDFTQTDRTEEIRVDGVIIAMGADPYDPSLLPEYGYGQYPDVVTSLEYERILSASGPWGGEIKRPSTGAHPESVAVLQCVGSRQRQDGRRYCSTICCMQATKDAIITAEHNPGTRVAVFYMDLRAAGKGFDRYVERARSEYGVEYIRSRVSGVEQDPLTGKLKIRYILPDNTQEARLFDLAVLSVGIRPPEKVHSLCRRIGVEIDEFGFVKTDEVSPLSTSRPGVSVCGTLSGPKDIPVTVIEASAAAAPFVYAGTGEQPAVTPIKPGRALFADEPRIGVFVCQCGINIASVVDCKGVAEYAKGLPNVIHSESLIYTCSDDSQGKIKELIEKNNLNRVVVAACSPRTHESLFQATMKEAELNPFLFEMANIRDQCSWVHAHAHEEATRKARELVRMSVSRVRVREPLGEIPVPIKNNALVIGGGMAGLVAGRELARLGFSVDLVEKRPSLGGLLLDVPYLPSGRPTDEFMTDLKNEVTGHPLITVHLDSRVLGMSGYVGNFKTRIATPDGEIELFHGATILATGASRKTPGVYGYGNDPFVITQDELEKRLFINHPDLRLLRRLVMIQCIESRDQDRSYCSVLCCPQAMRNAIRLKERFPRLIVQVLFREIRCSGKDEALYERARELGVLFTRFPDDFYPIVERQGEGFQVSVRDASFGGTMECTADMIVLTQPFIPNQDNSGLAQLLKVPLDQEGFFLEAHVKLRPVDFASEGIFLCGLAQGPKGFVDTIRQAQAAATRAAVLLGKGSILVEGKTSIINPRMCSGCGTCVLCCPYQAIEMDTAKQVAIVNQALCKGCGICVAACRSGAADLSGVSNDELACAIASLVLTEEEVA